MKQSSTLLVDLITLTCSLGLTHPFKLHLHREKKRKETYELCNNLQPHNFSYQNAFMSKSYIHI